LSWATAESFGRFEAAYRVWSALPALAAVGLVAWWAWHRLGRGVAVGIVILAALSPTHLELTPQARGYGLAMLAAAGMLISATRVSDDGRTRDIVAFALWGFAGIATLPVFLVAYLGHVIVVLFRPDARRRVIVATGAVGLASLVWYSGVFADLVDSSDQQFGDRLGIEAVVTGPFNHLARPLFTSLVPRDSMDWLASRWIAALVYVALVALCVWRLWRQRERPLLAHLLVPITFGYAALTIGRFYVLPRFGSFFLFHVLVVLALGLRELIALASRVRVVIPVAAVFVVAILVGSTHVADHVRRLAELPYEGYESAADITQGTGFETIITNSLRPQGLQFYLGTDDVEVLRDQDRLNRRVCRGPAPFVYIEQQRGDPPKANPRCLERRRAVVVHAEYQEKSAIGQRGPIDVWIVTRPPVNPFGAAAGARQQQEQQEQDEQDEE
jgi:hypothetical protein